MNSETFVVVGSGPSLTKEQANIVFVAGMSGMCTLVAVNDAYRMVLSPHILYACDYAWWRYHCQHYTRDGKPAILTLCPDAKRYSGEPMAHNDFGCTVVELRGGRGIAPPGSSYIMRGYGSGFQAVGLAIQMGAKRIALLGMDCKRASDGRSHYFGEHPPELPNPQPFETWAEDFNSLAEPASQMGIEIVNCTTDTAITAIPRADIADWLRLSASQST